MNLLQRLLHKFVCCAGYVESDENGVYLLCVQCGKKIRLLTRLMYEYQFQYMANI